MTREKRDYEGFNTRPMSWPTVAAKFERLSGDFADPALRKDIVDAVDHLETIQIADLTALLAKVRSVRT